MFVDGLEANGTQSPHASQQANACALAFGIVPPRTSKAVGRLHRRARKRDGGRRTSASLLDALHAAGRDDALVTALTDPNRPGYAQILKEGATFTWESWDARARRRQRVARLGLDGARGPAGRRPRRPHDRAGRRATSTSRVPEAALTRATGTIATERGPIPISWTRAASGNETIDVVVPVNVTATVHLAADRVADVSNDGRAVTGAPGVSAARAVGSEVVLTLGSGHYRLANTRPARRSSSSGVGGALGVGALALAVIAAVVGATTLVRRRGRSRRV